MPYFNIDDVKNNEQNYIDKSSARISRLFLNTFGWAATLDQVKSFLIMDQNSKCLFLTLLKDFDISQSLKLWRIHRAIPLLKEFIRMFKI